MNVELNIPNEEKIVPLLKCAAGVIAAAAVVKAVNSIRSRIKEKKQEKEIRKLKNQIIEQDARIAVLEKKIK